MSTSKANRITVTAQNQQLEGALPKYFAKKTFELLGETWTTVQVMTELESEDTLIAAAIKAHADWQAAASAARAKTTANDQLRSELKNAVKSSLGANSAALAEFGIVVKARKPRTPQVNLVAAAKAKATRLARNTLGPKARLQVKGVAATSTAAPAVPSAEPAAVVTNGTTSATPSATTAK
jgi:hypothetical protein